MTLAQLIEIAGFVLTVSIVIWNAATSQGKREALEKNIGETISSNKEQAQLVHARFAGQLGKMWDWKDAHEREAANMRLELQKQIGKVEAGISIHDGQYAEILRLIASMQAAIETKIDKIESKIQDLSHR